MDRDANGVGGVSGSLLRYNLIGIDCNSWSFSHIHTHSLTLLLTHSHAILQAQHNNIYKW